MVFISDLLYLNALCFNNPKLVCLWEVFVAKDAIHVHKVDWLIIWWIVCLWFTCVFVCGSVSLDFLCNHMCPTWTSSSLRWNVQWHKMDQVHTSSKQIGLVMYMKQFSVLSVISSWYYYYFQETTQRHCVLATAVCGETKYWYGYILNLTLENKLKRKYLVIFTLQCF